MANLPAQPNPADFEREYEVRVQKVSGNTTFSMPLNFKLVGIIDEENAAGLVFIAEGEATEFSEAVTEYNAQVQEIVREASEAGVILYSLEDVEAFVNGDLEDTSEPDNVLDLFAGLEEDDE